VDATCRVRRATAIAARSKIFGVMIGRWWLAKALVVVVCTSGTEIVYACVLACFRRFYIGALELRNVIG